MTNICL